MQADIKHIKALRKQLNLSCEQVAEYLNYTTSMHYYVRECGCEPFTTVDLATLAKLLRVPVDAIAIRE